MFMFGIGPQTVLVSLSSLAIKCLSPELLSLIIWTLRLKAEPSPAIISSLSVNNCCFVPPTPHPTEQYSTTKSSWLADYCKEKDEGVTSPCSAPMPWMGSSVDPPSVGQSKSAFLTCKSSGNI